MKKIQKGDTVIVLTGKFKGKIGSVNGVFDSGNKVLVENVNVFKKHLKSNPSKEIEGGIQEITKPIHVSNVAILNPKSQKSDRVGFRFDKKGKKERYFKSDQTAI